MRTLELLKRLEKIDPTDEQLALCMEIRKKNFPLPLYVKLPNGEHLLTRKMEDPMIVEGIATELGIYLTAEIHPIQFGNNEVTVADLYIAAREVHPDARPLTKDDIFGKNKHNLSSLISLDSTLEIMQYELNRLKCCGSRSIEFLNHNFECYALPKQALLSDTHIARYNAYIEDYECEVAINEIYKLGLFIPEKNIKNYYYGRKDN